MTRPSTTRAGEHPGTIVRGSGALCVTCYAAQKPAESVSASREVSKGIVLAVIPDRFPQRADCRPSCCRNPYLCRNNFHCSCHREVS